MPQACAAIRIDPAAANRLAGSKPQVKPLTDAIREFFRLEAASGALLLAAAVLALALVNSPFAHLYDLFLDTPVEVRIGAFSIAKPLLLWINDGLMAVFFFLVGLELKREFLEGELSQASQITLPALAAAGGMAMPALVFWLFNRADPVAVHGWAIPTATDIAFAVGVLTLLGPRVPSSLKVFLLTLAILDDLGAIVIIAFFYTDKLSMSALIAATLALGGLAWLNRRGSVALPAYLLIGVVLWAAVLKSGVHATLAGVALALFIPMRGTAAPSPLRQLEHSLHPTVSYAILPLFAFANAGVPLAGVNLHVLTEPLTLGIALGLLLGKTAGVFGAVALAVRAGLARLPEGTGWTAMFGVAVLCGIGFTMSLFISSLAFEDAPAAFAVRTRLGILCGSFTAGLIGYAILRAALKRPAA